MPKIGLLGILYLFLVPFIVFSGQPPFLLFLSLLLGYLLYCLFQKPSLSQFLIFLAIVVLALIILRPHLGLDMGLLNAINSQRGEHPDFQNNPFVYTVYTYRGKSGETWIKLVRFEYKANSLINPLTMLDSIQGAWNHDGSRLLIDNDLTLYMSIGDAANPGL